LGQQVLDGLQLKRSHPSPAHVLEEPLWVLEHLALPQAERDVRLDRRHAAEQARLLEMGTTPLDRLSDVGARAVERGAYLFENRAGEQRRFLDVGGDASIASSPGCAARLKYYASPGSGAFVRRSSVGVVRPPDDGTPAW
jgi:hypothetical protein